MKYEKDDILHIRVKVIDHPWDVHNIKVGHRDVLLWIDPKEVVKCEPKPIAIGDKVAHMSIKEPLGIVEGISNDGVWAWVCNDPIGVYSTYLTEELMKV